MLRLKLPKITSEEQYRQYVDQRERLASYLSLKVKSAAMQVNELNLRIIQWNCRNDEHNPVQTIEKTEAAVPKGRANIYIHELTTHK